MGKPSTPKVETPPPTPTYEDAQTNDDVAARDRDKRKRAGAVNSKSSILTESSGGGKTLLGQ